MGTKSLGSEFPIDDYNLNFIKTYANCIWSTVHLKTGSDLLYSMLLSMLLTNVIDKLQYIHLVIRFKYYEQPEFQVSFEIFGDILKNISLFY